MKKVLSIVGNQKINSKTSFAAKEISQQISNQEKNESVEQDILELASIGVNLFEWGNKRVQACVAQVLHSDVVIVASPTYKATYTGLLKSFLDQIPQNGLKGKTVIPVMVGADPQHKMAVDVFLTPLLLELGANCPLRGLFILESNMDNLPSIVSEWLDQSSIWK